MASHFLSELVNALGQLVQREAKGRGSKWRDVKTGRFAVQPQIFRLTVSVELYCGNNVEKFELDAEFSSYDEARNNIFDLTAELINENADHCAEIPKTTSWKIERLNERE